MNAPETQNNVTKRGAEDSGQYFRYMAEFTGFTEADAEIVKKTKPIIEKHLPDIVTQVLFTPAALSADAQVLPEEGWQHRPRIPGATHAPSGQFLAAHGRWRLR